MAALVALRVGIGFHFFQEGAAKLRDPRPYSAAFFGNAKGHLAPLFHSLVWDADGVARLDLAQTRITWDQYRERVARHYGFDDEQRAQAQRVYDERIGQLEAWLGDLAAEVDEYRAGLERRDQYRAEQARSQVASLKGQLQKIEDELSTQRSDLVPPVDQLWAGYQRDLAAVASSDQRERGALPLAGPGRRWIDSESIDGVIRYFDITIGLLLIVGLFTPATAVVAAAFLCTVIASQWPGTPGAMPVWPQFIEMLGLVVLAATGAGRFAGLDFFIHSFRQWCCPPREGTSS